MIDLLVRVSLEAAVLVCAIWIVLRLLPGLPPGAKALLWWCAAARVIVSLLWAQPIELHILPADMMKPSRPPLAAVMPETSPAVPGVSPAAAAASPAIPWAAVAITLWASGCGVSLLLAARRWRATRTAITRAHRAPASVEALAAEMSVRLRVRTPDVRLSQDVESPMVTGLAHPVILLPDVRFRQMPIEEQRMVLCHELLHIRRLDMWLGCIPAAAERVFFFHPFVRLAAREFAFWREAACDAAVIRTLDAEPRAYGRLLLDLGVSPARRSLTVAGAAWSFATMKRRIVMLDSARSSSAGMRLVTIGVVALGLLATVPLTVRARAVTPAQAEPRFDLAVASRQGDDLRFVFFAGADHTTMSGTQGDMERARRHRTGGDPLLWFVRDGREYIVRDATVLAELQKVWGPVTAVGAEQAEVGSRQAAIGTKQAAIGSQQAVVGAEQAAIGAKQAAVGARQAASGLQESRATTDAERAALARDRRALDDDMRALDDEMRKLGDKMRALDPPMRDLDDDMRGLDREMRVFDEKMREAERKAKAAMLALIDRAISSGAARPVQ